MCKEIKPCCTPVAPPWEVPQVIPAQLRRVNNLIFRKIGQIARTNGVEAVTPMHGWIMEYLYRNSDTPVFQRDIGSLTLAAHRSGTCGGVRALPHS